MSESSLLHRRAPARLAVLLVLALGLAGLLAPGAAFAHASFDSSDPADGATVEGPLSEVRLSFTAAVQPVDGSYELLDPTGVTRVPTTSTDADGTVLVLAFDPPLDGGTYGLRWSARATDTHTIDGTLSFTVQAADAAIAAPASPSATPTAGGAAPDLDAFLSGGTDRTAAEDAARIGRVLSYAGTVLGVGTLAALGWVIRGRRDELTRLLGWARLGGLVLAVGGLVELVALAEAQTAAAVGDVVGTKPGAAALLKIVGGALVWVGLRPGVGRLVAPTRSLSAAVVGAPAIGARADDGEWDAPADAEVRWTLSASAAVGVAGLLAAVASYWFDGHTVSQGVWPVHALVNLVHVTAASVWAGGVLAMTAVAWMRRRRHERSGLTEMVVRFSSVATLSLAALAVAGAVMAVVVTGSVSGVFSSEWGRVLLAKIAAVAVAVALGGYNHLRLRPALERNPDDPVLLAHLRRSLLAESGVLVLVLVLTAWLVGAAI